MIIPKADLTWRGSQIHRDDILCLEHLIPINNLMCTASYDGEINVWSIDTEKLIMCLRKAPKSEPYAIDKYRFRSIVFIILVVKRRRTIVDHYQIVR